jgi:hypothetical protein
VPAGILVVLAEKVPSPSRSWSQARWQSAFQSAAQPNSSWKVPIAVGITVSAVPATACVRGSYRNVTCPGSASVNATLSPPAFPPTP